LGAYKSANNDGIDGVIHLLEKSAQQNGKEEYQKLFPNYAFCNLRVVPCLHTDTSSRLILKESLSRIRMDVHAFSCVISEHMTEGGIFTGKHIEKECPMW
jgi:hypothetical protein